MTQEDSSNLLPIGLYFYWYESKPDEEHTQYWSQLYASIQSSDLTPSRSN